MFWNNQREMQYKKSILFPFYFIDEIMELKMYL